MFMFSYGMNTLSTVMDFDSKCEPVGMAYLDEYHLTFSGLANIERGGRVYGGLWEIDDRTLMELDYREGYPTLYTRTTELVICNGKKYDAIVYSMVKADGILVSPSDSYLTLIKNGYTEFGIPHAQIQTALALIKSTV